MLRTAKSQQASAPQKLGATSVINPPWPEAALKTSVNDAKEPAPQSATTSQNGWRYAEPTPTYQMRNSEQSPAKAHPEIEGPEAFASGPPSGEGCYKPLVITSSA